MWYKKIPDYANLVDPVAEIRPTVKMHYETNDRIIGPAAYSMLHYHYVIPLDKISPATKFPNTPSGMRVLESDADGPLAIHELSADKNKPELIATFLGEKFISDFQNAISKIKVKEKDENNGEIRSITIPALNVEAVWLHYKEGNSDLISLVWEFDANDKELLKPAQFMAYLIKRKNKLGEIKDGMGG